MVTAPTKGELVSFVVCDLTGIVRGRAVPRRDLDRRMEAGVGWVPANQSLTPLGTIADGDPHGSTGDLRLMPDPATAVRLESVAGDAPLTFYLCDIQELDGRPHPCCPRTLLAEAAERLRSEFGLAASIAFEHEFQVVSDAPPQPPFSLRAQREVAPFAELVVGALEQVGAEPETVLPEYGAHQFEVTCRPSAPVTAADRAVVVREVIREVGRATARPVTFTPLSQPEAVGNGVHVHLSLRPWDADVGGGEPEQLSPAEGAFAAGVLRHARALCALTAPSAVSYTRLRPHRWSAGIVGLGWRNREALLRVCGPAGKPAHLEYRAADAAACPHLALAGLLQAGLAGLREDLATPALVREEPAPATAALPRDLPEALDALEADEVLRSCLPPLLLETYVGAKRAEAAALNALAVDERHALYRSFY